MGLLSWLRRGAGAPADPGRSPAPTGPVSVPAWQELPPVQRTLAAPHLVSAPEGFQDSLSTWRSVSFTTPLGHLVSSEAPSGLAHGLATPSSGPSSPPTVSRLVREPVGDGAALRAPAHHHAADSQAEAVPVPAAVPVQRAVGEAGESLVSARPVETSVQPWISPPVPLPQPETTAPDPSSREPGEPAPRESVQRTTAPARPHGGLGLGAPLPSLPPTAQRTPAASTGTGPVPAELPAASDASSETSSTNAPTVARAVDGPRSAPAVPDPPHLSESESDDTPAPLPVQPLLGDDPLVPRTAEQHDPVTPRPQGGDTPLGSEARPPVPLQRAAPDGTPIARPPEQTARPVVPLVAQRSVPLFSVALPPPSAPPPPVPSAVPVRWVSTQGSRPVQRSVATPVPAPTSSYEPPAPVAPLRRTTVPDAGSVAVAAGVAQRMADGSVVFRPPPREAALRKAVQRESVQREAASDGPSTPGPPPPPEPPHPPPPEPSPESRPEPEPAPSAPAGHGETTHSAVTAPKDGKPAVTDELVRALFAPLSRLLKAELRLERERAGFLIDTRH
ncbi:hypothetical protein [Streptomyces olivoreticuli]|uniref:hypothetical protein n=1 Tax=Streptomyces olivoreticuli TaxID=68246 RepID=UPI000E2242BF|nr:hypothetical protein [Streptomyces olivoreticuli]